MKKILIVVSILLFMQTIGYCQESSLQLTIESDKEVYEVGDEIVFTLTWQNISNKDIHIHFREDMLLQHMLSFSTEDNRPIMRRLILIEFAPQIKEKIASDDAYSYELKGRLLRKNLEKPLSSNQDFYGNLILEFEGQTLSRIPILLGKPGKFYVTLHYELSPDSYLAKNEPETWTGSLTSNTITIEVVEKKGISKAEILKIAKIICKGSGWEWNNINIYEENNRWHIVTKSLQDGDKVRIFIDKYTGEILNVLYNFE